MWLRFFFIVTVLTKFTNSGLFTETTDWKYLFHFEGLLIENIQACVFNQSANNAITADVKNTMKQYTKEYFLLKKNVPINMNHPIFAYCIIKRLEFWKILRNNLTDTECTSDFLLSKNINAYLPSDEEHNEMIQTILRLQQAYNLSVSNLANGIINGVNSNCQITDIDCFNIGYTLFGNSEYNHAVPWFYESISRTRARENYEPNLEQLKNTYNYLITALYLEGNLTTALISIDELLEIIPNDKMTMIKRKKVIRQLKKLGNKTVNISSLENNIKRLYDENGKKLPLIYEEITFNALCQNKIQFSTKIAAVLKCKYLTTRSLYTTIAPFKLEELHNDPKIVIFHDVLFDVEIEKLKHLSKPFLTRSGIKGLHSDETIFISNRTSQISFLADNYDRCVEQISQRIQQMTGLLFRHSEDLQMANYGFGGHYIPHWDFFSRTDTSETVQKFGNRIATVLFYLNEVDMGGATVFPLLNLTIWPQKGSAAFWYNLHASGDVDYRTRHAACPVLLGNKWVANKWIREKGQEFHRPCKQTSDFLDIDSVIDKL